MQFFNGYIIMWGKKLTKPTRAYVRKVIPPPPQKDELTVIKRRPHPGLITVTTVELRNHSHRNCLTK